MRIEALVPDAAIAAPAPPALPEAFARALDGVSDALTGATRAEDAFAAGRGSLQDAAYERARADIAISVATAVAGRTAQVAQSLLSMQV